MSTTDDWTKYTPLPKSIDHDDLFKEVERMLPFSFIVCCATRRTGTDLIYKNLSVQAGRKGVTYQLHTHRTGPSEILVDEHIYTEFTDPHEAIKAYDIA